MLKTPNDGGRYQTPQTRNLRRMILVMATGLSVMGNAAENSTQMDRAPADATRPNHQLPPGQISEEERRALLRLKKALREKDDRTPSERCVDEEIERLDRPPSDLEWRVIDLKCREVGGPSAVPED